MAAPAPARSFDARPGLLRRGEEWLERAARHRVLCCIVVALAALGLRVALIPLFPIPEPTIQDEFSYVLAGETFAKGRLASPPHPLSEFFETAHVNMRPTYASKYPPGQGLALALGIVLLGHPWFGVLISVSVMCGLVCWAVQGWLPPKYGLYGGLFTILIFGLGHYWVNSYWGGAVAACGGALVLGAMPRLVRRPRPGAAAAAACGVLVLSISRPFEGLVFVCATGIAMLWWIHGQGVAKRLLRPAIIAPALLILLAGAGAMAYYNFAVTGSASTMPYSVQQRQYASTPVLWVLPPQPPAHREYRDRFMRELWEVWDAQLYLKTRKNPLRLPFNLAWIARELTTGAGGPLGMAVLFALALPLQRKTMVVLIILGVSAAGICLERWLLLHYLAPVVPAVILLSMLGMRVLRFVSVGRQHIGLTVTALMLVAAIAMAALAAVSGRASQTPGSPRSAVVARRDVERKLRAEPGQHVVVVRYSQDHDIHNEIVYNGPDIDAQKIVWAIDRGEEQNQRLTGYFRDRHIWLLQPDPPGARLAAYPNE